MPKNPYSTDFPSARLFKVAEGKLLNGHDVQIDYLIAEIACMLDEHHEKLEAIKSAYHKQTKCQHNSCHNMACNDCGADFS